MGPGLKLRLWVWWKHLYLLDPHCKRHFVLWAPWTPSVNKNLPWDRVASFPKSLKQEKKVRMTQRRCSVQHQQLWAPKTSVEPIQWPPELNFPHADCFPILSCPMPCIFQTAAQLQFVSCVFFMRAIVCRRILAGTSSDELFVGSDWVGHSWAQLTTCPSSDGASGQLHLQLAN